MAKKRKSTCSTKTAAQCKKSPSCTYVKGSTKGGKRRKPSCRSKPKRRRKR